MRPHTTPIISRLTRVILLPSDPRRLHSLQKPSKAYPHLVEFTSRVETPLARSLLSIVGRYYMWANCGCWGTSTPWDFSCERSSWIVLIDYFPNLRNLELSSLSFEDDNRDQTPARETPFLHVSSGSHHVLLWLVACRTGSGVRRTRG